MGYQTAAGSTLAISVAAPATQDAAGYAALTFTVVGGTEKIGVFGPSYQKVEYQPLNGPKEKLKGPADYGSLAPSIAVDRSDAGQALLKTAAYNETNALYSVLVTEPDGTKSYSQGRVFGFPKNVDAAGSVIMINPSVELCKKIVEVLPS